MRKRSLSTQALSIQDWMKYRPYERFSNYDGYYLKQANAIFNLLNHPTEGFRKYFKREHLLELAILITCHFEDFINDIGLWKALVRKHRKLYGYAIPFYKPEGYDPEYLNPHDFAYLIWHHLGKMAQKTLGPFSPGLRHIAYQCYQHFEARIDEAPVTDFYEKWLKIGPDTPFFDLKRRLKWMAFENYLIGPEFGRGMIAELNEMAEKHSKMFQEIDPGKMAYSMEDEYLYQKSASWCAMTAPDWLADVARCPEEVRPKIRRLFQRVTGTFLYDGCDDHYYHFRFIRSNRLFHIRRESVNLETDDMRTGVEAGVFGIVNWCGDWWLSGTYMGWELSAKDIEKIRLDPKAVNFYGWTDAEQQLIRDRTAEMESAFIEYFGDRLVVFPNQKAMAAAMEAQQAFWNEKKVQKSAPATAKSKLAKQIARQYTGFKDLNFGDRNSVAAYFIPGEGVFMSPVVPELIHRLQADKLSTEESDELFYTLFKECTPPLARLLVERYTGKNLIFPQMDNPDFVAQHFEFFLHYYNPGDFREVVPNLSLVGEREASHTEEVGTKK